MFVNVLVYRPVNSVNVEAGGCFNLKGIESLNCLRDESACDVCNLLPIVDQYTLPMLLRLVWLLRPVPRAEEDA